MISLNATQVHLSNWAAGGLKSLAGNSFVNLFANIMKANSSWENSLDLGYGSIKQGDSDWIKS